MERKIKVIIAFAVNLLFILAMIGIAVFASIYWGEDKKKDYDMSGVVFDGLSVEYDGLPHSVFAANLPEGISVSYENNDQTEIGTYTVTAHFSGDVVRYNPIPDKTATLTITYPAKGRILSATGFEIDETSQLPRIFRDVPNTVQEIDLSDKITVMPNRTWKLFEDADGNTEITSKSMSLETGHNTAYIVIYDLLNNTSVYEVCVYRLAMKSYTFKNDGEIYESGTIEEKSALESPANPQNPYYTFEGWTVEGSEDIVRFPYTVTEDITFVARYSPTDYAITYYLDGGINDARNPEYYNFETPDIELFPATRDGCVFEGWYSDGRFSTAVTVIEHGSFGAKELYAKWTPIEYKINYYLNGGENDPNNPDSYNILTPDIELLPATREYYDFAGWFEDGEFNTQVTVIGRGSYGEKSLYAKWTLTEYAINYHLNGGRNDGRNPAHYNILTPDIELYPATCDGYVFVGWYADSQFGTEVTVIESGSSGEKELYAKWTYGSEGLVYELSGNEYKVVGYNGNAVEIIVPDKWKNLPVTSIDKGVFADCTNLETLTLPFAGGVKEGEQNTHFGYIFGADSFEENATCVPSSLKTVVLTGGSVIGAYAFINCKSIENLTLPDELTAIGVIAFTGCTSLKSIEIPASVTQIGGVAFYGCTGLESLIFGNGIQINTIYNITFGNCASLKSIEIPASVTEIWNNAFDGCASLTSIIVPGGVTSIYNSAFRDCTALESVTFGKDSQLTYIGDNAFSSCSKLKSITIPDEVTSIGSYAFRNCTNLTKVVLGENGSLSAIGEYAFRECGNLADIIIPNSVTSIGVGAFVSCWKLAKITLPFIGASRDEEENTYFGYLFGADTYKDNIHIPSSLKTVIITDGETIRERAFYQCANIESITISDSVTSIGSGAFEGCTGLEKITIPFVGATKDGATDTHFGYIFGAPSSGDQYQYLPSSLKTVIITGGSFIDTHAFYFFRSLESIEIPASVTSISTYAFYLCDALKKVVFAEGSKLTSIGANAFSYCSSLSGVYITDIASWCSINFEDDYANPLIYAHNLYLYNTLVTELEIPAGVTSLNNYVFHNCTSLNSVTIPNSVTSIGDCAFINCLNIKSIICRGGLTSIGSYAFSYCTSLTDVVMPNSVTSIGDYAFYGCTSLVSIAIPRDITTINNGTFSSCTGLESITFAEDSHLTTIRASAFRGCTSLKNIEIPDSVNSIGDGAFFNCKSFISIEIPDSVTSIGCGAFEDCTSLEKMTIPFVGGTKEGGEHYNFSYIFGANKYPYNTDCVPSSLKTVIITGGSTIIGGAFSGCSNLERIEISASVTCIEGVAFKDCTGLISITICDNSQLTTVGDEAFKYCTSLKSIDFGNNSQLDFIGEDVFWSCTSLKSVNFGENSKLTSIGYAAFYECKLLQSIEIPASVTYIGRYAVENCINLKSVVFKDTDGWQVDGKSVSSSALSNPATAAEFLTKIYLGNEWRRS